MATTSNKRKSTTAVPKVGANEMGKLPPQAPELEESVLGALMIEKDAYDTFEIKGMAPVFDLNLSMLIAMLVFSKPSVH